MGKGRLKAYIASLLDGAGDDIEIQLSPTVGPIQGIPSLGDPDYSSTGNPPTQLYSDVAQVVPGGEKTRRKAMQIRCAID